MKIWGWVGMGIINICYLPQLIKVLNTGEVAGLSSLMYGLLAVGLFCYLIYSIKIRDTVYIVSNLVNMSFALFLLGLILFYGR